MYDARLAASFRDPSGFVFRDRNVLLRQINIGYLPHFRLLQDSGLYDSLVRDGLLIPHQELDASPWASNGAAAIIQPELVPFVSYPYEWSFGQLKAAALATLEIHRRALQHGMALKDATAYNIQWHKGKPTLIDTLSFETYEEGAPWIAYRQFCEHFLAPLVLMSMVDIRLGRLMRDYIDGIPLDLAASLAPGRTKFSPGLAIHLHAHARAQVANASKTDAKQGSAKIAKNSMLGLIDNLHGTIEKLDWKAEGTVWSDYYSATNYTESSFVEKKRLVGEFIDSIEPKPLSLWDLGANTGEFTSIAAEKGIHSIAWDIDPGAVERGYRAHGNNPHLIPLLQDLTNPSPGIGWANRERDSLADRGPAGAIMALALVHHLAIGNNVPLAEVAKYFAALSEWVIVEFVPKSDSQVQRLLATRKDIYDQYTSAGFEEAFASYFSTVKSQPISGSERTLYLFRRNAV